jgi:hypothetical protein
MNDPKRLFVVLFLLTLTGVAGILAFSRWQIAADWRAEAVRQQELATTATQELSSHARALEELRAEVGRQRATSESLAAELRGEVASQRATIQALQDMRTARGPRGQVVLPNNGFRPTPRMAPLPPEEGANVVPLRGRPWGPEQAIGAPDTFAAGDMQTAWASRTQDDMPEWLMLDYAQAVKIARVKVYETYNPGALVRVTAFDDNGKEIELWQGKDPTAIGAGMGVSEVAAAAPVTSKRIKIYLDSMHVPGWNEIDAVGIVDDAGKTHWATGARASSTYAEQNGEAVPGPRALRGEELKLEF